uniref:Tetraspanin-1 n=1 Tax=Lepisosteus oculatus TaxID=7918 RepID=W5MN42_LEPOC
MGCFGFLKFMMFIFNGIIFVQKDLKIVVGQPISVVQGSSANCIFQSKTSLLAQIISIIYCLEARDHFQRSNLAFLSCSCDVSESQAIYPQFFIIVLIIFIAEVAGAVVVLVFSPLAEELIRKGGEKVVEDLKTSYGSQSDITTIWNNTMKEFKCCGFNNYTDFMNSSFVNAYNMYPEQCCKSQPCNSSNVSSSAVKGCFPALVEFVKKNAVVLGAVALGIAALEIAAMVASMTMYCKISSK